MNNTLSIMVFCISLFSATQSMAEFEKGHEILGIWLNAEKDGLIKIVKNENNFEGVIVGSPVPEDENRLDINNPDPKLRNQSLQGLVILKGFLYQGDNKWTDGQIYDPNNGETYRCNLELINPDNLSVRGYIGISLFGRTEIWTRKH